MMRRPADQPSRCFALNAGVTPQEFDRCYAAAKSQGKPLAHWLRDLALAAAEDKPTSSVCVAYRDPAVRAIMADPSRHSRAAATAAND